MTSVSIFSYKNQIWATVAVTVGAFGLGTVLGWSSPAIPDMKEKIEKEETEFDLFSEETESWIGSITNLGALVSAIAVGILIDIIGRKMTMLLLSAPFVLGWLLVAFAKSHTMLIGGRVISGFCGGGFSLVAPLFIAEIAEKEFRGALGTVYQIMVTLGILFVYAFGYFLTWNWLSVVCGIIPLVFLVTMIFVPESPRYLVRIGEIAEANKSLSWFNSQFSSDDVEKKILKIEMDVKKIDATGPSFRELFESRYLRPSLLIIALMFFQQMSGINAIVFYSYDIFKTAGSDVNESLSTIIVGVILLLGTCSSAFLVDRVGRKILLLLSSAVMCISLVFLGTFFQLQEDGHAKQIGWLSVVSLMIFVISYSIGYGPVPFVLLGELIPQKVKARAASAAIVINCIFSFLVTKYIKAIREAISIQWCYWMFAMFCFAGFLLVFMLLPETKGKSVEEIQSYFGGDEDSTTETKINSNDTV